MAHEEPFRFLDLPPEIRNTIYELTFRGSVSRLEPAAGDTEVEDEFYGTTKYALMHIDSSGGFTEGPPGILLVTKQIRSEAVLCFYAGTTFVCGEYALIDWAGTLPRAMTAAMTDVRFEECWLSLPEDDEGGGESAIAKECKTSLKVFRKDASAAGISELACSFESRGFDRELLWTES